MSVVLAPAPTTVASIDINKKNSVFVSIQNVSSRRVAFVATDSTSSVSSISLMGASQPLPIIRLMSRQSSDAGYQSGVMVAIYLPYDVDIPDGGVIRVTLAQSGASKYAEPVGFVDSQP